MMKTLCEFGQKRDDNEPGSILTEIARVIFRLKSRILFLLFISNVKETNNSKMCLLSLCFSLPAAHLKPFANKLHNEYYTAYDCDDNCADRYAQCTESIWADDFLLEMIK